VIRVADRDALRGGEDPERVEIVVRGGLKSPGRPENPVTFTGPDWYGIRWETKSAIFMFDANPASNRLEGAKAGLSLLGEPFPTGGVHLVDFSSCVGYTKKVY
jgi:hypothetical protein